MAFSKSMPRRLWLAGWRSKRSANISKFETVLGREGFKIHEAALVFLKSFGGLKICYPISTNYDVLDLDPRKPVQEMDSQWIKVEYSKRTKDVLCPIGEFWSGHYVLIMGISGKVFAGFDYELFLVADNGESAIEAICSKAKLHRIP